MKVPKPIKTIFYQGIYNSQVQLAKYLDPTEGFVATTGETIKCGKGLDLIINPFIGSEIDEIEPYIPTGSWNIFKGLSYIFSILSHWANGIEIMNKPNNSNIVVKDNIVKSSLCAHYIKLFNFNFGQEGDLANHYDKYIKCLNDYPDHNLILWGVSKGAATTLNALAKNNYDNSKIKMVVLEGCYTNIEEVFKHWLNHRSYFDTNFWIAKIFLWLLRCGLLKYIIAYKTNKEHDPINLVGNIPHIPIVFITSMIDIVVPAIQTIELYEKLKENGHPNVHLLILKNSRHHAYMFDDEEDKKSYENFIYELYSQYNINRN